MAAMQSSEYSSRVLSKLEPHLFVIIGATGDLARRKLFPAMYKLSAKGVLKNKNIVLGVARNKELNDEDFRIMGREMLKEVAMHENEATYRRWCDKCLHYQPLPQQNTYRYRDLASRIETIEKNNSLPGNRIFYMAVPPKALQGVIEGLGKAGLNKSRGWTRIVLEKPFGLDLASAKELNRQVHKYFDESQIYRIDHFLGKETVQNILVFRFANTIFEELWNREHIDSIQITVAESIGVGDRAGYYEQTGALADMVQNHLTQVMTLITMEDPETFKADAIRYEKAKVLRHVLPIKKEDVVFGQYTLGKIDGKDVLGYTEEPEVPESSQTETFVALRLEIANWRWKGVPIFLRTGKRMARRLTQVEVKFHAPPVSLFSPIGSNVKIKPNTIIFTLQPDEGFDVLFQVKAIGQPVKLSTQKLHFRYSEAFGRIPMAYETLLLDIILGDQALFVSSEWVEESWRIYSPLVHQKIPVHPYPAGSWGPPEADELVRRYGTRWLNPGE